MRGLIWLWILCAGIGWTGAAPAAPAASVKALCDQAKAAAKNGDAARALQLIDAGLSAAPKHLELLGLKGRLLIELDDLPGALAAFQEFLRAGAEGKAARDAKQIVNDLTPVQSTFLDIEVDNGRETGPTTIYYHSTGGRLFCTAAPTCHHAMRPRVYTLTAVAARPGFERWTGQITITSGTTTTLHITLAEKPSLLTVMVTPPDAQITVDGAPFRGTTSVAAGKHQVVVSCAGYAEQQRDVAASAGDPVELPVVLVPLPPIRIKPPQAALALDDKPIDVVKSAPQGPARNPTTALLLSLGGTAASWGVVAAATQQPKDSTTMWTLGTIGAVGTLLAPSFGHWYAHSVGTRGFLLRLVGVAAVLPAGVACNWGDGAHGCGDPALALAIVGGAIFAGGTINDIASAPDDARDYLSTSASTTVVPMILGDRSGLAIAGRF